MTTLAFSPSASTVSSLKAPLWSGTELVPQMDRRPDDGSGDGVAGDDFGLVLDIADNANRCRLIGSLGSKGHADDEKKSKLAQTTSRSVHGGFREPSIGGGQS